MVGGLTLSSKPGYTNHDMLYPCAGRHDNKDLLPPLRLPGMGPMGAGTAQGTVAPMQPFGQTGPPLAWTSVDRELPYELRALEAALHCVTSDLSREVTDLESKAAPGLDALVNNVGPVTGGGCYGWAAGHFLRSMLSTCI